MRTFTAFLTVSGLVLALAPAALGANGDIAIFSEATGTDVITTAVFDHGWDTTVRTSPAYDLVGGAGGTEIQLIDPGHYLVMYNSRFDSTGGSDRSVMQCNLSLDGNSIPTGWSQGYIRRTQGTDETVASGGGIIDVAANDLLKVQTFRTDTYAAGGVQRAPAASGLQLVKLNDSWSYARLSLTSTQTGPTGETFTDVTYDRQDELDTAVFGHTSGSGDILLKEAGHYLVLANTYLQKAPNTTRTTHAQRLTLDDTEVEGSYTTVYMRGTSTCDEGAAALGMIIETSAADQILNVEIAKDTGTTSDIVAERTAVTIVRLPDDADYIRLTDTDNNVNPASTTAMAWDDEVELDADGFARPTSSQVAAAANDDYLFLTAFEDHTTGEQSYALPYQRWRENDTTIFEYGQSVGYHRATQNSDWAGGWSGLVLGMDSGDYVEVIMDPLSNNTGALTAEHMGLQGVRLGSLFAVALVWDGNDPGAWMSNHWSGKTPVGGEDHIVNSGKVEVQSDPPTAGRLTVNGGEVEVQATWTLGVSASVTVNGGTLDVAGLLNAGSLIVAPGGTLELGGTVDANSVTMGGTGTIASTALLDVAEAMTVEATSLDMNGGALTIGPGGTLAVQNNASLDMNAGTLTTTGATVAVGNDSTPGDTSTLTIDAALAAANLTLRNGGSLVHQGNGVTLTDSLALSGSDLDMTGALLTTTGADVTIGSTLTVDNQTLAAAGLDIQGTLVRTGANQNVTITDSLTLGGSDLDMTGALLTTAGAAVTIGAGRNLTVDNQTLEANDLDVQGTLTRTGANQDVTITNSLTLGGDDLDMTGHTLTAAGAALTVESGRTLKTDNTPLAARTVDVSDGGTLDTSGDTDLVLSEALRLPGLSYTLSGGPQFTAAWDNTAGKATQLTLQGGMMTVAAPSLAVPGGAEMYYSFDDPCNPFNDGSAGGSHSATAMGTAPAWTPGGQVNGAVAFDGNDTGLRPADWGFMEDALTEVAIAMWFNQDSNTTGNDTLVDEGGTTNGLGIILDEGVLKATVRTSGTPDADVSSAGALAGWHHMGLVFGRETGLLELYLDGSPVDSNTFGSSTLAAHTDDPGIGFTNAGNPISSGYFWGLMDEFLYYERALTADEMIGLYGGAATADLTGVDVLVTADSGMTLATPTRLGYLTIDGDRTFTLAGEPVSFNSTTLTGSPSAVEIGSSTQAHLTAAAGLDAGGTDVTITKSGAGEIILSLASNVGAGSKFVVTEGTLTAGLPGALASAGVELDGGGLLLSSTGGAVTYDNAVSVTSGGSITAGKSAVAGGADGPLTVTLGSAGTGLAVDVGATVTLGSTDDYTLSIAGAIDDGAGATGGSVAVDRGTVNVNGGADVTDLSVSGTGVVDLGGDVTVTNLIVRNDSIHAGGHLVNVREGGLLTFGAYENDSSTYAAAAGSFQATGDITKSGADRIILGGAGSVLSASTVGAAPLIGASLGNDLNTDFPNGGSLIEGHPTYTITASGSDIWTRNDGCYFGYQEFGAGDTIDISARVGVNGFQGGSNGWRKAGVMIRGSLDPNSRNGFTLIAESNGNGINAQIRPSDDVNTIGATDTGPRTNHDTPVFLRLTYDGDGNTFGMYYKDNDEDPWILIGTNLLDVGMTGTIYAGLALTSHNTSQQTTVEFDFLRGFQFDAADVTPFNDLTGEGTIIGDIRIDGELAPGLSLGEILADSVTFADSSTYAVELDGNDSDLLAVTGDLTIGTDGPAMPTITLTELGPATALSYPIITWTGTRSGEFDPTLLPTFYWLEYLDNGPGLGGTVTLNVPEPATLALLAFGGALVLLRRRRS